MIIGICVATPTVPARTAIRRPSVAYIPVIRRGIGARLLLVLGVIRIVPAGVVHELAVHPRRVQISAVGTGGIQTVDIRVVRHALEVRSEELVPPYFPFRRRRIKGRRGRGGGRVHAEMIVPEPRLARSKCE